MILFQLSLFKRRLSLPARTLCSGVAEDGGNLVFQLETPLAQRFLIFVGHGFNAGFGTVNLTIDVVILICEPRKMRIFRFQPVQVICIGWKLINKFMRCIAHISLPNRSLFRTE